MTQVWKASQHDCFKVFYNTNPVEITEGNVILKSTVDDSTKSIENDMVYIFAGGELPSEFLKKIGLKITKKYGEAVLKHK